MTIKNGDNSPDFSRLDLNRTSGSRQVSQAGNTSSNSSTGAPSDDSIALSSAGDLVSQLLNSADPARAARTQQLKYLIETNQYHVDAASLSSAIIDAHFAQD
jgi:anti-sigma28 factor (negative regulator of flagellin synthesis)